MTDRQFTACCYGTDHQHAEFQECPVEMRLDTWTGQWIDRYNDVFVGKANGGKLWTLSSRERGNQMVVHSRHRELEIALSNARRVVAERLSS